MTRRRRGKNNNTNGTTSQGRQGETIRVRGIPKDWNRQKLQSILLGQSKSPAAKVIVKSLAQEIDGSSLTATVTLQEFPAERTPTSGKSWSFALPESDYDDETKYITLDVDFLGVTTLFAPPDDSHQVE